VAKKLGGGYASTVHLAVCKASGVQVAIKVYHRCKLSQLNNYQVHREIRIHSCLDHKNVLQLVSSYSLPLAKWLGIFNISRPCQLQLYSSIKASVVIASVVK
jgi:serine/threonine protein kinase